MRFPVFALTVLLSFSCWAMPRMVLDDRFSASEQHMLRTWVEHNMAGLESLLGPAPGNITVHLERAGRSREPVPWARTNKRYDRSVHFHVDPRFPLEDFIDDWTGAHELVHLLFPYLGERSRWFAEGIATYLQFPVMYSAGSLAWDEAVDRMQRRLDRARAMRQFDERPITRVGQGGWANGANVRLYWGGASYFLLADRRLHQQTGQRLTGVIRDWLACCSRRWGGDADSMMRAFDRVSGTSVFTDTYAETVARPGFPEVDGALDWLRRTPPAIGT